MAACNNSETAEWIVIQFGTGEFCWYPSTRSNYVYKRKDIDRDTVSRTLFDPPIFCVCLVRISVNDLYFLKLHTLVVLSNRSTLYSLWGTNWIFRSTPRTGWNFPWFPSDLRGTAGFNRKMGSASHSSPPGSLATLGSNPNCCLSNQSSSTPNRHIAIRSRSLYHDHVSSFG